MTYVHVGPPPAGGDEAQAYEPIGPPERDWWGWGYRLFGVIGLVAAVAGTVAGAARLLGVTPRDAREQLGLAQPERSLMASHCQDLEVDGRWRHVCLEAWEVEWQD